MSSLGILLTVVAAAGWSGLDIARKVAVNRMKPLVVLVWLVAGQTVLFSGWAAYEGTAVASVPVYAALAAVSVALNVVANLAYLHAVRISPFSVVIPMLSFVPVFTVAAANPLLGEMPSQRQLVGIAVVVIGTLALGATGDGGAPTKRGLGARLWGLAQGLVRERGAVFMLATALCWSMTMVVDKMALQYAPAALHGLVLNAGVGVALVVWLIARGRMGELGQIRGNVGVLVAAVATATLGLGAQLFAVQLLLAGVVEAIKRAFGLVVAVLVGRIFFGEALNRPKVAAVVLMSLGTALIVL